MSGGTFDITTVPIQIYQGTQQTVTLVNQGPYPVWVADDSSVTPNSGYLIPALGQLTWSEQKPLWAVTNVSSRVQVTNAAIQSLVTRAKFWTPLNQSIPLHQTDNFFTVTTSCAHCETLFLVITVDSFASTVMANPWNMLVTWNSEDAYGRSAGQTVVEQFQGTYLAWANGGHTDLPLIIQIPVKGSDAVINFNWVNQNSYKYLSANLYGTDRILPFRYDSGDIGRSDTGRGPYPSVSLQNSLSFIVTDNTDLNAPGVYIPALGDNLHVLLTTASVTAAGELAIIDGNNNVTFAYLDIVAGKTIHQTLVQVPRDRSIRLQWRTIPTFSAVAGIGVTLSWTNNALI